jgi:hypothetical protein
MGRPKSKEVETVEKVIENMHNVGKLTAQTKPRDVAAKLSPAVAKEMENRISPILKAAKERLGVAESDKSSDWRKEMKRLTAKIDELGGAEEVEELVTEAEKIDQRRQELDKLLRSLGGVSGAKQALGDLASVADLFKKAG